MVMKENGSGGGNNEERMVIWGYSSFYVDPYINQWTQRSSTPTHHQCVRVIRGSWVQTYQVVGTHLQGNWGGGGGMWLKLCIFIFHLRDKCLKMKSFFLNMQICHSETGLRLRVQLNADICIQVLIITSSLSYNWMGITLATMIYKNKNLLTNAKDLWKKV